MLTHFGIYYLTNLTYFPIFLHFVDFSKVAAASPLVAAAAAAAAQLAADRSTGYTQDIWHSFSINVKVAFFRLELMKTKK